MVEQIPPEKLDAAFDRVDALIRSDYAAATLALNGIPISIPPPSSVRDPFSPTYADWVRSAYLRLTGLQPYDPATHEADRNIKEDISLRQYFPFTL